MIEDPAPAPLSTRTRCPWVHSSLAPSGVSATRFSPALRSVGTPTITDPATATVRVPPPTGPGPAAAAGSP